MAKEDREFLRQVIESNKKSLDKLSLALITKENEKLYADQFRQCFEILNNALMRRGI